MTREWIRLSDLTVREARKPRRVRAWMGNRFWEGTLVGITVGGSCLQGVVRFDDGRRELVPDYDLEVTA